MTEPRPDQRARYGSAALATAVTVAFGYLAVRNVDIDELGESLRESNYWFLLPAFGLLVLAFFLRVLALSLRHLGAGAVHTMLLPGRYLVARIWLHCGKFALPPPRPRLTSGVSWAAE